MDHRDSISSLDDESVTIPTSRNEHDFDMQFPTRDKNNRSFSESVTIATSRGTDTQFPHNAEADEQLSRKDANDAQTFVDWDSPDDPENPQNWANIRKFVAVLSICSLAFSTSFSSSIFAPACEALAPEFHVSETVANLGVSLYVIGFAAGKCPLIGKKSFLQTQSPRKLIVE
jgi:hypothetical protein